MPSLYTVVKLAFKQKGIDASTSDIERIVGSLRLAGFIDHIDSNESRSAKRIALSAIDTRRPQRKPSQLKVASIQQAPDNTESTFKEIGALIDRGLCPRCEHNMSSVKLVDYSQANYCPSCRTTIWQ